MAQIYVKLEEHDISTTRMGNDFMVVCDKFNILITPKAFEKMLDGYKSIIEDDIKELKEPQKLITEK